MTETGPVEDGVIRVFLVDDQELVRAGFTMLVDSQAGHAGGRSGR